MQLSKFLLSQSVLCKPFRLSLYRPIPLGHYVMIDASEGNELSIEDYIRLAVDYPKSTDFNRRLVIKYQPRLLIRTACHHISLAVYLNRPSIIIRKCPAEWVILHMPRRGDEDAGRWGQCQHGRASGLGASWRMANTSASSVRSQPVRTRTRRPSTSRISMGES